MSPQVQNAGANDPVILQIYELQNCKALIANISFVDFLAEVILKIEIESNNSTRSTNVYE